jgi:hypothetical protein
VAIINISEQDFESVASAAFDAQRKGDRELAVKLDKIARKISAALSKAKYPSIMGRKHDFGWRDVPSTLVCPSSLNGREKA